MLNKITVLFFILFLPVFGFSQDCSLTLSGYVKDSGTGTPLEFVTVFLKESNSGTTTDSTGFFQFSKRCAGESQLVLSRVGCPTQRLLICLNKDTSLQLYLENSLNMTDSVLVTGTSTAQTTKNIGTLNEQYIADNANKNLSNMLESITGVRSLRNGNGISKPIVHGLYGNRLTILNNGIAQSGQQWGNDHSPEIDPMVANRIRVIKGTGSLEYMGSNLGSVILIVPGKIERNPHLHGSSSYFFETNGFGHGINLQLQHYNSKIAWKINGTLKKSGDKKTSTYYLNNTGGQEANLALQLEKSFSEKFSTDLYFSSFNTELGVLRGSHIGNLTDLENALHREVPFYTEHKFSYKIEAPKQRVSHHLLKIHAKYFSDARQSFDFTFAGQANNRKEYDVRRSGRSDIPALSLQQFSYFTEIKHQKEFDNNFTLQSGLQSNITDNTNNPETGILPLIPDYLSYETGLFVIATQKWNKSFFEGGVRYDNVIQSVYAISNTSPRRIVHYKNIYHNANASAGWTYLINDKLSFSSNIGFAMRNPAINELYSNGLHQGVSGIEEGSETLQAEKSLKSTLSLSGNITDKLSFESLFYYQNIQNYIYLKPQNEIRLTIRGSFPVFRYEQSNAQIYGLDFSGKYQISKFLFSQVAFSFIRGDELNNKLPLINIPSGNISGSLGYQSSKAISIGKTKLENFEISLHNQYVFRQAHLLVGQDFVMPPKSYNLLGFKMAGDIQLGKTRLRWIAKVDNILNVAYRDYLNRQRYFANDLGINATFGISLKF